MPENTYLLNGRFLHNLNGWTASDASVVYSAGDGDEHYGVAVVPVGQSLYQEFAVNDTHLQSLHIAVKPVGGALSGSQATLVITDGDGNSVLTQNLSGLADTWNESTYTFGLAEGTTYRITINNNSAAGNIKIDDVWLWFVPMTRAQLAQRVHGKLGRLASERNLYPTPTGVLTEGSYTYAVDAALRFVGAVNEETGLPDVRSLEASDVQTILGYVEREMLEQLQKDFAVEVDTSTGPYSQSLSQKREAITEMLSGSSGGGAGGSSASGPVVMRKLEHE